MADYDVGTTGNGIISSKNGVSNVLETTYTVGESANFNIEGEAGDEGTVRTVPRLVRMLD